LIHQVSTRHFLVDIILKVLMDGLGMVDGPLLAACCLGIVVKITYVLIPLKY